MKSYAFFISSMRSIVTTYSIYPPAITNGKNSIIYNILYTVDYYTGVRLDLDLHPLNHLLQVGNPDMRQLGMRLPEILAIRPLEVQLIAVIV
jgi:hypothetical protein